MKLYSTSDKNNIVDLKEAVLNAMPRDKGLYMPFNIPRIDDDFYSSISSRTFAENSFIVAEKLIGDFIPRDELEAIVTDAINFPAPVVGISEGISTLELFHGPSLAFKDFGARFMSRTMSYFNRNEEDKLTILVATSGDTGGAVAAGFYDTPGIEVIILYPSGKVSDLQEKQLTTLGKNIYACEIDGTFDDCQALVKRAFLDDGLTEKYRLSSANSINIARLIPQSFYYFEAYKQVVEKNENIVFCIPSGNFGNLTAGLMASRMGLPVKHFIAATNINKVVPDYLDTGNYQPQESSPTISNAMDVGSPSNFSRMLDMFNKNHTEFKNEVKGFFATDEETEETMKEVYDQYRYILDPHGAIGYRASEEHRKSFPSDQVVFLETAHPGKFLPTVERVLEKKIDLPQALIDLQGKEKEATPLSNNYTDFKEYMISRAK